MAKTEIRFNMGFQADLTVTRVCRETGEVLGTMEAKNAITAAGITRFIDLIVNDSSSHVDAGADLKIYNEANALQKTLTGLATGYPQAASGGSTTLRWADETVDTYEVDDFEILAADGTTIVATITNSNFGTKPTTENWLYDWTLSVSGSAEWTTAGLNQMLDLITGEQTVHWEANTGAGTLAIDVNNTDTPGNGTHDGVLATVETPAATTLEYEFPSSPPGVAKTWAHVRVMHNAVTSIWEDDIANQTQGANDTFTYVWTITFADDGTGL